MNEQAQKWVEELKSHQKALIELENAYKSGALGQFADTPFNKKGGLKTATGKPSVFLVCPQLGCKTKVIVEGYDSGSLTCKEHENALEISLNIPLSAPKVWKITEKFNVVKPDAQDTVDEEEAF